ncbi:hypothetical protein [Nafulsella turpanensis]|uniref:hypothetical protein n=1 Tax=Nafulsella turpanensis TaxID=1265690 RepID=UPI00034C247F|nr:hypothetical protein [Nafulsella turpanensis]
MSNKSEGHIFFFLKFGSYEHMLDLYENGTIFFNSIDYFQKLEEQGLRGDNYEGTTRLSNYHEYQDLKVTLTVPETGKTIDLKPSRLHLREFLSDLEGNVFCLYCLKTPDILDFDNFKIDSRVKEFGSHFVMITDLQRFLGEIKKQLDEQGIDFQNKVVQYYDRNKQNGELSLFHKPEEFEYQKEYRIILFRRGNKPFKIKVGSLKEYAHLLKVDAIDTIKFGPKEN